MAISKDEIVKSEILTKAQGLFQVYGLKKTTMDEIAAACGKAKSTLYHYFKSKEEVFDAVIDIEITSLRRAVKDKVEEHKGLSAKIKTYFITFYEEIENKINLYRVVKQEVKIEAIGKLHFKRLIDFERDYITRMLNDGYDAGEFTDFAKEDFELLSTTSIAAFLGIVRYVLESEEGIDKEKLYRAADVLIPRLFI